MPREFMCAYGNCQETETPILVSVTSPDVCHERFCSLEHLILWAEKQAGSTRYAVLLQTLESTVNALRCMPPSRAGDYEAKSIAIDAAEAVLAEWKQ